MSVLNATELSGTGAFSFINDASFNNNIIDKYLPISITIPVDTFQNTVVSLSPSNPEPLFAADVVNWYIISDKPWYPLKDSCPNIVAIADGIKINIGWINITIAINFISFPSIFFLKNSGVLPTISPHINTPSIAYNNKLIKPTPFPPKIQLSIIFHIGTAPPIGVSESCILFTDPVVNDVVITENNDESNIPFLTSLPSIFPIVLVIPSSFITGFPFASAKYITGITTKNRSNAAIKIARPCFLFLQAFPKT